MTEQLELFPVEESQLQSSVEIPAQEPIKDAEWCFQFFNNEPVVFGWQGENTLNRMEWSLKYLQDLFPKIQNKLEKSKMKVKIKKLHPNAVVPQYAKSGDGGMDLVATSILSNTTFDVTYGMGIALEIPEGFVGLIFPRSSIRKTDLALTNCVGVVDSGYRGELQATFKKVYGKNDVRIDETDYKVGDRIAQFNWKII